MKNWRDLFAGKYGEMDLIDRKALLDHMNKEADEIEKADDEEDPDWDTWLLAKAYIEGAEQIKVADIIEKYEAMDDLLEKISYDETLKNLLIEIEETWVMIGDMKQSSKIFRGHLSALVRLECDSNGVIPAYMSTREIHDYLVTAEMLDMGIDTLERLRSKVFKLGALIRMKEETGYIDQNEGRERKDRYGNPEH